MNTPEFEKKITFVPTTTTTTPLSIAEPYIRITLPTLTTTSGIQLPVATPTSSIPLPIAAPNNGNPYSIAAPTSGIQLPLVARTSGIQLHIVTPTGNIPLVIAAPTSGIPLPIATHTSAIQLPITPPTRSVPLAITAPTSALPLPIAAHPRGIQLPIAIPTRSIPLAIAAPTSGQPLPIVASTSGISAKHITTDRSKIKSKSRVITDKYKPMCNWTEKELKVLLEEMKKGNEHDLKLLQEKILSKSVQDLKDAFSYLNGLVTNLTKEKPSIPKSRKVLVYKENIDQWIDVMAGCYNIYELNNIEYSDAVLELSHKMSSVKNSDDVNFSSILFYLVKMLKGEILPPLNKKSCYVFNQVVLKTILCAKGEMNNNSELMEHIKNLSVSALSKMFGKNNPKVEELVDLFAYDKYNPLKIPLHCLNGKNVLNIDSDDDSDVDSDDDSDVDSDDDSDVD